MASINFNLGRNKFVYEGTSVIPFSQFNDSIICIRELNEDGDFPGIPAHSIWSSYFPGIEDILNAVKEFRPGRTYEVDAKIPFTLDY